MNDSPDRTSIVRLRGHKAVLQHAPMLADLAAQSGLTGCMDQLAFFHSDPYFGGKEPNLLLLRRDGRLRAAALLHEYRAGPAPLLLFIPADANGERSVIAPAAERVEVSCLAARFLLDQGALIVMMSPGCSGMEHPLSGLDAHRSILRAFRLRTFQRDLPLTSDLQSTLSQMGAHTRRNLRAFRRQAEASGFQYAPTVHIGDSEFLDLNQRCAYPVPPRVALWRWRTAEEHPGGFVVGLRDSQGMWVALAGGRRHAGIRGRMTTIDWQMNRTDLAKLSLGTTLRAYILEDEVARGSCLLRFEGGTPHSMRSAFLRETVADLIFTRPWLRQDMIRTLAGGLRSGNLMGETLLADDLQWT